ncbi:hypothetical protein Gohar_015274, partial [Gossypium harknessii]|nr:hypothetical protein [Gossypium harknessii]
MGKGVSFLLLALVLCYGVTVTMGYRSEKQWRKERERREEEMEPEEEEESESRKSWFLMPKSRPVMTTDAGEMRLVRSPGGRIVDKPLHMGFITMEPQSLFIPQYLDSSLTLFVRTGEARVGCIYKDEMVERRLKIGDVYHIPAGSTFYILNPELQVSMSKLEEIMRGQQEGPIVHVTKFHAPSIWTKLSQLQEQDRLKQVKRMIQGEADEEEKEWSWWKLF